MRIVIAILVALLLMLQVELWRQYGQIGELMRQVETQLDQNQGLSERNDALAAEVADLKSGLEAVEERARAELGLVRDGERFYLVVDPEDLPEGQAEALRRLEGLPAAPDPVGGASEARPALDDRPDPDPPTDDG
ncbi:cell division protein FtsB [Wenzhouxiangella sp. XN79A]|uniref:septum formation initiator family protein n=1 Tax=Wenzhouxiangella sp. XN79A TaxID=2724193 RepID=UPI00144AC3AE|nr:septum formation initiator family protein [Wenzhouxiangella sp. XN79A]NKI35320.1 cell division protein FtsB [Wenzhouxiangella sp. XN79A]